METREGEMTEIKTFEDLDIWQLSKGTAVKAADLSRVTVHHEEHEE